MYNMTIFEKIIFFDFTTRVAKMGKSTYPTLHITIVHEACLQSITTPIGIQCEMINLKTVPSKGLQAQYLELDRLVCLVRVPITSSVTFSELAKGEHSEQNLIQSINLF